MPELQLSLSQCVQEITEVMFTCPQSVQNSNPFLGSTAIPRGWSMFSWIKTVLKLNCWSLSIAIYCEKSPKMFQMLSWTSNLFCIIAAALALHTFSFVLYSIFKGQSLVKCLTEWLHDASGKQWGLKQAQEIEQLLYFAECWVTAPLCSIIFRLNKLPSARSFQRCNFDGIEIRIDPI